MKTFARALLFSFIALFLLFFSAGDSYSQEPTMLDPNLGVRRLVGDLITPTTIAFIGDNGSGTATIWLNQGTNRVCFDIRVANILLPATP